MAEKARKEGKATGGVAMENERRNMYRHRNHLRETPEENEGHSEDEHDPNHNGEQYLIHEKEGCNSVMTSFFRLEDQRYQKASKQRTGAHTDRIRVEPAVQIAATVTRFPSNVPIDYFEPSFFNQMSDNGVALPIPEICADGSRIAEWKNLPYNEFMEKFGNDTLKMYNLPTEAELEQLQEYNDEISDEDED
ncbi:hypothetical protein BT96DRAFT_995334 [Gymnopus androsaceus JB14]|uniref:Uncharacterized protein n=1 Tax=Gymnopus androsaceus JB14 TaxID=1447944 RepID=A0A6A4HGW7_9AGAR|nr:hypothetical protein BT96DRAFT_995334 [Gymnopus androsaceus JB14]